MQEQAATTTSASGDPADIVVRPARREDCLVLTQMSKEIANYHKHTTAPVIDPKVLEKDAFDTANPIMGLYIAETKDGKAVGYGQYNYSYTLRLGRTMVLQDLWVRDEYRNRRVGHLLLRCIAKKAIEENIGKMEFVVTDWNPAKSFYKKRGAVDVTATEQFHEYQFDRDALERIASS